VMGIV